MFTCYKVIIWLKMLEMLIEFALESRLTVKVVRVIKGGM